MRCPRCGNENPGTNRFCGMCGATLLPAPVPATQAAATTTAARAAAAPQPPPPPPATAAPSTTASRTAVRAAEPQPVISGPSFLGLNQPAPSAAEPQHTSLSIDPNSAPSSGNLDYLLEDEEPRHGGAGKYIFILIALLLAAGFGYLRWRHQPFPWQISGEKKPSAIQPADQTDTNSTAAQNAPNLPAAPLSSDAGSTSPQPATSSTPAAASPGTNSASGSTPSITPAPEPTAASSNSPALDAKQPDTKQATPAKPMSQDADSSSDLSGDAPAAKPAKPKSEPADAAPKPAAAVRSAGTVAEAQRYLYGKGVRQDCDRGLRLLKPAADRADPKAMIEMGALYSAGLCTPRDLPTAYRWFAMALRKEPDNQTVQTDLQKLWSEMTQPERQLAIKLSQ